MSYIGLLNESISSTYTNVSASDDLTIGSSLRNLGSLTQIGPATFSGSLNGLLTAVSNGADLTYTYAPASKIFTIQINNNSITNTKLLNSSILLNGQVMSLGTTAYTIPDTTISNAMLAGSIALSKLISGVIGQIIVVNALGNAIYGSLTLNNLPFGTANQFLQTSGSNNTWTTLSGDASLSSGVLTIGNAAITNAKLLNSSISLNGQVMLLGSTAYTMTTTNITQGTNYYLNALTTTSPNEITLTLTSNNLTGSLINNTIDISKIKTAQIDSANTLSTLIKRDGATGGFYAGQVQLITGNWETDIPSLILGQNNGVNEGVVQMWGNATTSILMEASTAGALQLYQKVNTVSTLIADINPTVSSFNTNVNITSGHTYTIDNAEYLTTKTTNDLIEGTTNKYYSSILAQADSKLAISATDSTEIDFTYTAGNITASLKAGSIAITKLTSSAITIGTTAISLGGTYSGIAGALSFTGTSSFTNGSNVQGVAYSAVFGQASTTRSGQIVFIDGTSNNQYAQLYCRSNVFGIQGNITSISLQKPTTVTAALSLTNGILNLGVDATTNSQIVLNSALSTYAYQIATNTIGELSINTLSAFASVIKIGADIFTQTTIGKLIVSGLTQLASVTASGTATITGLTSANGGLIIGTNGTSILRQKLYSVTSSVGQNTTTEYNLTISGFTATPNHIIASIYNAGMFNCSIIARATTATNINYWIANQNIIPSTFTAYFTICQI